MRWSRSPSAAGDMPSALLLDRVQEAVAVRVVAAHQGFGQVPALARAPLAAAWRLSAACCSRCRRSCSSLEMFPAFGLGGRGAGIRPPARPPASTNSPQGVTASQFRAAQPIVAIQIVLKRIVMPLAVGFIAIDIAVAFASYRCIRRRPWPATSWVTTTAVDAAGPNPGIGRWPWRSPKPGTAGAFSAGRSGCWASPQSGNPHPQQHGSQPPSDTCGNSKCRSGPEDSGSAAARSAQSLAAHQSESCWSWQGLASGRRAYFRGRAIAIGAPPRSSIVTHPAS